MTVGDFSVLLPVYAGDQPEFFFRAVSSATRQQELSPKQLVVVCDGPVDESISDFLHRASRGEETDVLGHIDVRVVRLKHNMGLANALNIGLAHCSHDIVARVDADDISLPQRFAIQIPLVEGGLGLLGSAIQEFSDDEAEAGLVRSMPTSEEEIRRVISYRSPFAHPSVVYRKSAVEAVGGYEHLQLMEDYLLFARMVAAGVPCGNAPEVLVRYRVGSGAYKRRGGRHMLRSEMRLQKIFRNEGIVSNAQFARNLAIRGGYRLIPTDLRQLLYRGVGKMRWFVSKG
ncbi:glycosyl transferase [Actinomyces sp. S6-Spd3]|uniref:glycosyltransferase n=1 Tax=Actinomyces sp. S6-Spd3 TaxID=1284680 RepID=UPI0005100229|nr:glycosyltransferase [Actinomyces sp. S6-Spd3]KGE99200.1 glycosyl transferase [Actinomyces sp. S6-Spd3]